MSGTVQVRPARLDDAAAIAAYNQAMAVETEGRHLDAAVLQAGVTRVFEQPDLGTYHVAELDGRVVGCLLITYEWSDWRNGLFWWIQSVYVDPGARRRGVFRSLYAAVREAALRSGQACGLRLYVERDNRNAQHTYRDLGMGETAYALFEEEFGASD